MMLLLLRRRRQRAFSRRSISRVEVMDEPLIDGNGNDAQGSDGVLMTAVSFARSGSATVPRDAQDVLGRMTPLSSTATVLRDAQGSDGTRSATVPRLSQDSDGVSSSALQLLLTESAAPAFIGEASCLVPN